MEKEGAKQMQIPICRKGVLASDFMAEGKYANSKSLRWEIE
jgi:hypothetical protein